MNDFKLKELQVTIKEVSFGTKKLTKSIFNQIEFADCFNKEMDFIGDAIIGYVKDKDNRYLLWVINGKLRKTGLRKYEEIEINVELASLQETEWFLRKTNLEYSSTDDYRDKLPQGLREVERYVVLVKKAWSFIRDLSDQQIYL